MNSETNYSFSVEGMTCASCSRIVERTLSKMDNVHFVSVNLATEKAYVVADNSLDMKTISDAVAKTGYRVAEEEQTDDIIEKKFRAARKNTLLALGTTVPVMILMILHMSGVHIPGFIYMELTAGLFILLKPGFGTLKGAWIAVTHGHTNMDTLVSLSAAAALATGFLNLAGMNILSFASIAAMVMAFHITGRYIEARLKQKAAKDIKSLLKLQPKSADIETTEGIQRIPVESVKEGAVLRVRTGERIPLDGKILTGSASVDESMITGEPLPVLKSENSQVTGGTVVTKGSIRVEVEKVGSETFLAQMVKLVEEAQSANIPLQALADRISLVFIPVVMGIALISAVIWGIGYEKFQPFLAGASVFLPWINPSAGALSNAVFVFVASLVIACPCALGLATPMALIAGSGKAASRGIILKNGEAIQKTGELDIILMDKTGTITEGKPDVTGTDLSDEIMAAAAALEDHSVHPLGNAIINYAKDHLKKPLPEIEDVREIPGKGMSGIYKGKLLTVGKPEDSSLYSSRMRTGATVVEVIYAGRLAGTIEITDPVKPDSKDAILELINNGIKTVMITGDAEATAKSVAETVGITDIHAGVLPEDKAALVRDYQRKGYTVGMVGDGINDAAALKTADTGFAIGTGTELSIESADIVLSKGELSRIPETIAISGKTVRTIKQNLFWAFFYNIVALPMAAAGLLHPVIAEIAMSFSSINVILNSLRIRSKK